MHPDRLFLEAFSQDQSAYAQLILDPALFRCAVPDSPSLAGIVVRSQVAVLELGPGLALVRLTTTNALDSTIGAY